MRINSQRQPGHKGGLGSQQPICLSRNLSSHSPLTRNLSTHSPRTHADPPLPSATCTQGLQGIPTAASHLMKYGDILYPRIIL